MKEKKNSLDRYKIKVIEIDRIDAGRQIYITNNQENVLLKVYF